VPDDLATAEQVLVDISEQQGIRMPGRDRPALRGEMTMIDRPDDHVCDGQMTTLYAAG
jgi:hypothetical protein